MPTKARQIPSYRLHKPTVQAVVRLNGRDYYLGKHGTEASQEAYRRLIAEWLTTGADASGHPVNESQPHDLSIGEMILAFWAHAEDYYRRADGTPTGELDNFRHALKPLRSLYAHTPARVFGTKALKAVRQEMIEAGLCRNVVNQRVGKIVRVFKWATENELIPATVHHALITVSGLKKGRSKAPESRPVKPVPREDVEVVLPHVSPQVKAMIELQSLSGMRPGEVTIMRTSDLDMSGKLWVYVPERHKTEHHDKDRTIYLGPKAQNILRRWLRTDLSAYLFSPKEAAEERWAEQRRGRKSPMTPSQRARGRKVRAKRTPGEFYNTRAYAHAIHRGCRKAGIPLWGPNRLRHNAATAIRKEFDIDTARAVLGHEDVDTTIIYAERDGALASSAMERIG